MQISLGLSDGRRRWFLTRPITLYDAGRLAFFGSLVHLADRRAFLRHLAPVSTKRWAVYANAISTLEAMRLFLFLPNTAFMVAADEEMIRLAVAKHFSDPGDRHITDYLDKLIQVPIRVPKLGLQEVRAYLVMLAIASAKSADADKVEAVRAALISKLRKSWSEEPPLEVKDVVSTPMQRSSSDLSGAVSGPNAFGCCSADSCHMGQANLASPFRPLACRAFARYFWLRERTCTGIQRCLVKQSLSRQLDAQVARPEAPSLSLSVQGHRCGIQTAESFLRKSANRSAFLSCSLSFTIPIFRGA